MITKLLPPCKICGKLTNKNKTGNIFLPHHLRAHGISIKRYAVEYEKWPSKCGCGCDVAVAYPYKFRSGHATLPFKIKKHFLPQLNEKWNLYFTGSLRDKKCLRRNYGKCSGRIEIHHVDKNRSNNSILNQMPLCKVHHQEITSREQKEFLETRFIGYQNYIDKTLHGNFYPTEKSYVTSFIGKADVTKQGMCDLDDINSPAPFIKGFMLHFIAEFKFSCSKREMLLSNNLLAMITFNYLNRNSKARNYLTIKGNDIFYKERKLCVGIGTTTSFKTGIIHFALNLDKDVCPLPISCLKEFVHIDPRLIAIDLMYLFGKEICRINRKSSFVLGAEGVDAYVNNINQKKIFKKFHPREVT